MDAMISISEAAKRWQISTARITKLCRENRIAGAVKSNSVWMIPETASKPVDGRIKNGAYVQAKRHVKLPLPIGISDYKKASSEYYYIDKTLMIRDFLDEVPMVSLFTRPRRFGKTLNMDMLKTFFEKTDEDTSVYFTQKKIWKCGESYRAHQGKYPVVFLSFKDVKFHSWNATLIRIKSLLQAEFFRHSSVLNSEHTAEYEKVFFRKVLDGTASEVELTSALEVLSRMLHEAHGIEPIIIIDEYDTPIQQGHVDGYYEDVVLFIRNLFSAAFKDNRHLKYGFLTGILRVARESIFSGLNNLRINSILDHRYSEYFGFTADEVREMAVYYGVSDRFSEICDWYDGYRFGRTDIFNPWSVVNYFSNDCVPEAFWLSTGSNEILGELLSNADEETYHRLHKLLQGETIYTYVDTSVIYPQIPRNPSSIYSFLLVAGYLKALTTQVSDTGDYLCEVAIPNKEIAFVYRKEILSKLSPLVSTSLASSIRQAIFLCDSESLKKLLEDLLRESASSFDTAKETFYHGLVLGLCALFSGEYYVSSNREFGYGRYDIQLMPKQIDRAGFIFELKSGKDDSPEALVGLAQDAIRQIEEKHYDTEMSSRGIRTIIKFGVAFCGKRAEVVTA